ncbi:hypothetical protein WN982_08260 [Paraburkholderia sp. IMGN_8]|uniref:DUF6895 family protein n=1 Tax=Paraburkholderia sp. IMGN_8 TaxID=3136564 RepID=UPI003101B3F6
MRDTRNNLAHVLGFARSLLMDLDSFAESSSGYDPTLDRHQILDKLIAETALLLLIANRIPQNYGFQTDIRELSTILSPHARTARHLFLLASSPQAVGGIALAHIALTCLGERDETFDAAVQAAFASPYIDSIDRPNFRQMEIRWLYSLYSNTIPDFSDLLPCSIINKPMHPIFMRREDAYAVTHAAMYLTDFGRSTFLPSIDRWKLCGFIDHSISWCLAYSDWDLLGEIVMVQRFLRSRDSIFSKTASSVLSDVFSRDWFIPGPNFIAETYSALPDNQKIEYAMVHGYHSTYVYGILCSLDLIRGENTVGHDLDDVTPSDEQVVAANSKLIKLAREARGVELMQELEQHRNTCIPRVSETCEVAAEAICQTLRASAYRRLELEPRH